MPEAARQLAPKDVLSRFLVRSKWFSKNAGVVRPAAFMPYGGTLSVFVTTALARLKIWEIGAQVATRPDIQLYGRGDLMVAVCESCGLAIDFDNTPERHASVTGWPDGGAEKHACMSIAQQLAAQSELYLIE